VVLIALGLFNHWNLTIPVVAVGRFLRWLIGGVICSVPVFAVGALLLGGRLRDAPPALAAALRWGAGCVVVIVLGIAMLATGFYSPLIWHVLATLGWLGVVLWVAARRWRPITSIWRSLRSGGFDRPLLFSWTTLLVALAILTAGHASLPPDTRDELAYHLVLPQMWSHQGDWWLPADNPHMMFPANTELVWAWADAVSGPLAPRFVTLVFALLTVAVLREWLVAEGRSPWVRNVSLVVLLVTPVALTSAAICYVEWPLLFYLFLGWRLSRGEAGLSSGSTVLFTGAAWAVAMGMKYSAMLFATLLALEWIAGTARRPTRAILAMISLIIAVSVLAAPWWIRNWVATGDPWFPLGGAFGLGTTGVAAAALTGYVELEGFWRWMPWLYHSTVESISDHRLHPLWPVLHLVVLVAGWRLRRNLPWFTVVVATAVLMGFTPAPRVELPLMLLVWLFLPGVLAGLENHRTARRIADSTVAMVVLVSLPLALHYLFVTGGRAIPEYLLGISDHDRYLGERGLLTPAVQWVHAGTPEDAKLWAWCEDQTLYFSRWTRADSPYGQPAFLRALESGGADALTEEAAAVDYVILNRSRCAEDWSHTDLEQQGEAIASVDRAALQTWATLHLQEEARDRRYVVYRVSVNR